MEHGEIKRVGIIGGTFNPVHVGHLMLAEWAKEAAGLDEVLFIPTGFSYMKKDLPVPDGAERLHMVDLAIGHREDFKSSDIEVKRPGNTYTYETLELIGREKPGIELYFIMGADCLYSIDQWSHPERIFAACTVIAAAREGSSLEEMEDRCRELEQSYRCRIYLLSFPAIEISSSYIRRRLREGKSVRYLVPDEVLAYIEAQGLYTDCGRRRSNL